MAAVGSLGRTYASPQLVNNVPLKQLSQRVLEAVRSSWSCFGHASVQNELSALRPSELKRLLDAIILEINPKELEQLADLVPLESLQNAIRTQYPLHLSALQSAKGMFCDAKYFLEATASNISPTMRTRLSGIFNAVISVLESILNAFGVADFFKPSENALSAEFKGQKIMMLISLFTMLSTLLLPLIGGELVATVLGGTLLTISALSIIYPYFKPASARLPRAENWSQQFREGNLVTSGGRKGTLDEIARTLIASKLAKTHVMMIGKTGIGKTETAKAFVEAVVRGDYPELLGKEIHYINTAELLGGTEMFSNGNKILSQISEAMGRHRENYILIFDEIHMACQKKENSVLSEQLKTLLDAGKDNFPYVIGITTEEEFLREIYVNNAAFARRFKCISLENTEDPETLKILGNSFIKKAAKIFLEQGALSVLLQKTKAALGAQAAEPASALKILSQCIKRIENPPRSSLEGRVDQLRSHIQAIYSEGAVGQGNGIRLHNRTSEQAARLEAQLHHMEIALAQEQRALAILANDRGRLADVKTAVYKSAVAAAAISTDVLSSSERKQLSSFLLQSHCLAPALEAKILSSADQLGVRIVLDSALIDEVIGEEIANDRKALAAVERGRSQIAARIA